MVFTLGTAAKAVGLSKSSIHRAIKNGTISAIRKDDGSYEIQPAELFRSFPPVPENGSTEADVRQGAPLSERSETVEMAMANARLEGELNGLKELLRFHKEQVDDLRTERDRLLSQMEASQRLLTHSMPAQNKSGWWRWRRAS